MRRKGIASLATALALAAGAVAARADWLVTKDGARVETQGPWTVKGKLVVFTERGGALASLRLAEVDLEASAAATATARAAARAQPPVAAPRPPVLVLTDADVAHVEPPAAEAPEAGGDAAAAGTAAGEESPREDRLVVTDWDELDDPRAEGTVLTGSLRNRSRDVVGSIRLRVNLHDAEGNALDAAEAALSASTLRPSQNATFRVAFPRTYVFSGVRFEADGLALRAQPEGSAASEEVEVPAEEESADEEVPE